MRVEDLLNALPARTSPPPQARNESAPRTAAMQPVDDAPTARAGASAQKPSLNAAHSGGIKSYMKPATRGPIPNPTSAASTEGLASLVRAAASLERTNAADKPIIDLTHIPDSPPRSLSD